jgi:hypothetical protein
MNTSAITTPAATYIHFQISAQVHISITIKSKAAIANIKVKLKVKLSLCFTFNGAPLHGGVVGEWMYSSAHS